MSSDSSMETDGKSSFVSNTNAVIYGTATGYSSEEYEGQKYDRQSLISDPNIITSSSSSSDALITPSSHATSSRFEINKNHQQDQVSIVKVDTRVHVEEAEAEEEEVGSCDGENIFREVPPLELDEKLIDVVLFLVEEFLKDFGIYSDNLVEAALMKDHVCPSNISSSEEILKDYKMRRVQLMAEIFWRMRVERYRRRFFDKLKALEKDQVCSSNILSSEEISDEILEEILERFRVRLGLRRERCYGRTAKEENV